MRSNARVRSRRSRVRRFFALGGGPLAGSRPNTAAADYSRSSTSSVRDLLAALPDRPGTVSNAPSGRQRGARALKSCYVR